MSGTKFSMMSLRARALVWFLPPLVLLTACAGLTLMQAVKEGNVNAVLSLLAKGANPNQADERGYTLLMGAAEKGHTAVVQALLDKGAGPNAKQKSGWTALMGAAKNGHTAVVQALLDKGADPNAKRKVDDWTALIGAAEKGHVVVVQALLDKGADPNAKDVYGLTTLMVAAEKGHTAVVQALLDKGADVKARHADGWTALILVERQAGRPEIIQMLKNAEFGIEFKAEGRPSLAAKAAPEPPSDVDTPPRVKTAAVRKNAYVVAFGIETYRDLPKVDFAARDAAMMKEYLVKAMGYPEENIALLTNERATRSDLQAYLEKWLPNRVEKDGEVFIFYAGHGAPDPKNGEAYLVPYDGNPSFLDETAYPVKRLYQALSRLPTKKILVVLDSCFSGAGGRSVLAKGARPMVVTAENPLLATEGITVLAAASGEQISTFYQEKRHGLLTYFFLKGLQGEADANHDGVVDLGEVFEYLRPNVTKIARTTNNVEQTPQLNPSLELLGSRAQIPLVQLETAK